MIPVKGVIGLDINGKEFANMISRLSGDIEIEIDSPGGLVSHGISIFNALKRYDKGKVHIRVVGECSSMAAYIMLAGDTLKFEPNSIVVLHNPWASGVGDYRAMKKESEILEKMAHLYASAFVEKGLFDYKAIRSYMDEEKWFIGSSDLMLLGEVIKRDAPQIDKVQEKTKIKNAKDNVKAWQKGFRDNMALFDSFEDLLNETNAAALNTFDNGAATVLNMCNKERTDSMEAQELQQQTTEAFEQGYKAGIEKNQSRINALLQFIDCDKDTVVKAITEGKSIQDDEVFAKLILATANKNTLEVMQAANAPDINPKEPALEADALNLKTKNEETPEQKAQRIEKEANELFESIQNDI